MEELTAVSVVRARQEGRKAVSTARGEREVREAACLAQDSTED